MICFFKDLSGIEIKETSFGMSMLQFCGMFAAQLMSILPYFCTARETQSVVKIAASAKASALEAYSNAILPVKGSLPWQIREM